MDKPRLLDRIREAIRVWAKSAGTTGTTRRCSARYASRRVMRA